MTMLGDVAESVQQVAEAIALAIGVEVEIIDDEFTIVGGTNLYSEKIGTKEEYGEVDGHSFYASILRSGITEIVEDTSNYDNYGISCISEDYVKELAEICTPIKAESRTIGIIGLVAFNERQRGIILEKKVGLIGFVEKMADLLSAKAVQRKLQRKTEEQMNEISTIVEKSHEGILLLDKNGYIKHCNHVAEVLLKTPKGKVINSHINQFMLDTPAMDVLKNGKGYSENDEIYTTAKGTYHFIVSVNPFFSNAYVAGAVMFIRDIEDVKKLVYNMNNRTLKYAINNIIGESDSINAPKNLALITARGNSTVLITGESGTGKEMFAKAIHYASTRAKGPFVTVNCGAIPENLIESELFGYEKGAFTGAHEKGKTGKFEHANGGTLFLDEIGDMPINLQVKLLHVLQNMRFERVGGNKSISVDVRVIAATNRDLESMIKEGTFRGDLYYRLSVIPLNIPPLRERKGDIKLLMDYFLKKYSAYMDKKISGFTKEVEQAYLNYEWPGNVRELENAVEYGVNITFGNQIEMDALPPKLVSEDLDSFYMNNIDLPLKEQVKVFEKEILLRKLKKYENTNITKEKLARDLGMSRATFYRKLEELGIQFKDTFE